MSLATIGRKGGGVSRLSMMVRSIGIISGLPQTGIAIACTFQMQMMILNIS